MRESELRAQRERIAELSATARRTGPSARRRPAQRDRSPDPAQRVDRRRRRLGVRHRLGRSRSRPRQRTERQCARARHRGLLQYRRADVEGDAARCGREVRLRRQDDADEGSGVAGDRLRQRVRRARRDGRRSPADAERVPRGRGVRRAVPADRLQPLHRPRDRDARRARAAVQGRRERPLAAAPLRPDGPRRGRQPVPARLTEAAALAPATTGRASCASARSRTSNPPEAERLADLSQQTVNQRWAIYEEMATRTASEFPADARKDR